MPATLNRKAQFKEVSPQDSRVKRLFGVMNKYKKKHDALIEILHVVQDVFGYIPLEVMVYVARQMKIPPSRVYGVATFYNYFHLKPKGEHNCFICTGTACHVKGAQGIITAIHEVFDLKLGNTTPDGKLGLQGARCLGCCGLAPAVVLDNKMMAKVKPEDLVQELSAIIRG